MLAVFARYSAVLGIAFSASALLAGCQQSTTRQSPGPTPAQQPTGSRVSSATDPCASNLQEASGLLLQYYSLNRCLPPKLEDLKPFADIDTPLSLNCPTSNRPYVYNPQGLTIPDKPGRIVMYDAEPSHSGLRLAVVVIEPGGAQLQTRVIAITESQLSSAIPARLNPNANDASGTESSGQHQK